MTASCRLVVVIGIIFFAAVPSTWCATPGDNGPLRVHPQNPRYFTDNTGKAIYLTGSHTWSNLKDMGPADPPAAFDFDAYLKFLEEHGHNFIRLWTWELTKYAYDGRLTYAQSFPWLRTGPGDARDGKPKFDLSKLDPAQDTSASGGDVQGDRPLVFKAPFPGDAVLYLTGRH